jgi:hypothetical protein
MLPDRSMTRQSVIGKASFSSSLISILASSRLLAGGAGPSALAAELEGKEGDGDGAA